MKSTLKHYLPVAGLLAVLSAASVLLCLLAGAGQGEDRPRVLATTYPLYLAAQNILGDTAEVELTLLSGVGSGCLHDYQLTPADRLAADRALTILSNGLGAEPFLEALNVEEKIVDTAAGVEALCSEHHHEEEDHHDHDHEAFNEHIWLSPARYKQQVETVARALHGIVGTQAILDNAAAYVAAIDRVAEALPDLTGRPCVLFHDSLAYLAADVGLDVKLTLSAEGESGLSAAHLAQVERLAAAHPDLVLLYDTQYPIRYAAVDGLVPTDSVLALETAVVGQGQASDWLDAMRRNADKLSKLKEGDAP